MAESEQPQIYLVTPSDFELALFSNDLQRVLDVTDVACMRLSLATRDEDRITRAADMVREITHARDIAVVIDTHVVLVERLGLDGVHLTDPGRNVRQARKDLGPDAIVGAFCGASRHDGMNAGEAGADYVAFGPVQPGPLDDADPAPVDLFEWWSQMIELPVVAQGGLSPEHAASVAPFADFLALGDEIWGAEDPVAAFQAIMAALEG